MSDYNAKFLQGSIMSHVIRMTVTGMLGLTFMFVVDLANLFWISRLGDERLVAALGFACFVLQQPYFLQPVGDSYDYKVCK